MTALNPYVLLAVVLGAGGLALLTAGLIGRRVAPRRLCRRCRYEVGEQAQCPECGRDLRSRRGARLVRRQRRRGLTLAGAGLALTTIAAAGAVVIATLSGANLNRYKPMSLLTWELASADAPTADAAADELWARRFAGRMSDARAGRILLRALELHADELRHWPGALTAFIDEAMLAGRMNAEQIRRYYEHVASPKLLLGSGPPARAGASVGVDLDPGWRAGRFPPGRVATVTCYVHLTLLEPGGGAQVNVHPRMFDLPQIRPPYGGAVTVQVPIEATELVVRGIVRYAPMFGDPTPRALQEIVQGHEGLGVIERPVELVIPVAPPSVVEVLLDHSDENRAALMRVVQPKLSQSGDTTFITFARQALPVHLCCRITLRDPQTGAEWTGPGPLMARETIGSIGLGLNTPGMTAASLDVELTPWPDQMRQVLIERRADATVTIFGDTLVFKDVPVQRGSDGQ
jgi:hypothetical protein